MSGAHEREELLALRALFADVLAVERDHARAPETPIHHHVSWRRLIDDKVHVLIAQRKTECKSCATRRKRGFDGQCPACASERTRGSRER